MPYFVHKTQDGRRDNAYKITIFQDYISRMVVLVSPFQNVSVECIDYSSAWLPVSGAPPPYFATADAASSFEEFFAIWINQYSAAILSYDIGHSV